MFCKVIQSYALIFAVLAQILARVFRPAAHGLSRVVLRPRDGVFLHFQLRLCVCGAVPFRHKRCRLRPGEIPQAVPGSRQRCQRHAPYRLRCPEGCHQRTKAGGVPVATEKPWTKSFHHRSGDSESAAGCSKWSRSPDGSFYSRNPPRTAEFGSLSNVGVTQKRQTNGKKRQDFTRGLVSSFYRKSRIIATSKQHLCDIQFADVACALKTQTALIYFLLYPQSQ